MINDYKCEICGKVLTEEGDGNMYVVLGKGEVLCAKCESQTDGITLSLADLKAMVEPWGISVAVPAPGCNEGNDGIVPDDPYETLPYTTPEGAE